MVSIWHELGRDACRCFYLFKNMLFMKVFSKWGFMCKKIGCWKGAGGRWRRVRDLWAWRLTCTGTAERSEGTSTPTPPSPSPWPRRESASGEGGGSSGTSPEGGGVAPPPPCCSSRSSSWGTSAFTAAGCRPMPVSPCPLFIFMKSDEMPGMCRHFWKTSDRSIESAVPETLIIYIEE